MPRPPSDDGYDSDSGSEFDASDVQLGLADGYMEKEDESNPLVSRIGGRAAWLPMKSCPEKTVAECNNCKQEMQLLVQIFAPLVESPYDRCLLVWGCARPACQRKDISSLKVIRTLKFNRRWAAKLEKQKAKRLAKEQAKKERQATEEKAKKEQEERSKINPFASTGAAGGANGGLGGMLFGGGADNPFAAPSTPAATAATATEAKAEVKEASNESDEEGSEEESDEEDDEQERLAEELALKSDIASTQPSTSSAWVESSTRYPAYYLNTVPEPSSSSISKKLSKQEAEALKSSTVANANVDAEDPDLKGFAKEGYEKMLLDGIDDTFERFLKRVEVEPRQAVRYEFGGEPLAFHAKGKVYDLLWPGERKSTAAKGGDAGTRAFTPAGVPPCDVCGGERVFEAQLMPNLINLLKTDEIQNADGAIAPDTSSSLTGKGESEGEEAKRKAAIEQALGRRLPNPTGDNKNANTADGESTFDARSGLVWSTAFIFTCAKDCCQTEDECWKEEVILAQFEDEQ